MDRTTFPKDFLWGAGSSSHQVEGGNKNDWTVFEEKGGSKNLSGRACNQWNLKQFQEDLKIMKEIGLNAYRMSIEWSRVMPEEGVINQTALDHYKRMLTSLKEAGISPMVTLHHFTNPIWFAEQGGWLKASLDPFYRYADATTKALSGEVDYWNTINEPLVIILMGYLNGQWPPAEKKKILSAIKLRHRFAEAHNRAYEIAKRNTDRPTGIVHNFASFEALHNYCPIERLITRTADEINNEWIIKHTVNDFIGVNFYMRLLGKGFRILPPSGLREKVSDFDWEIVPQSLARVLVSLKKYNLPIYITENGVADAKDSLRADFIRDHVESVKIALKRGVDVKGYFYWSLLDNFEWAEGFTKKFGLVEVDFKSQQRKIRPSAYAYRDVIEKNS